MNLNLEFSPRNVPTVEQLRKNGFKVRVLHERFEFKPWTKLAKPPKNYNPVGELKPQCALPPLSRTQKGGKTTIQITSPQGKNYQGVAICSLADSFDRKKGVKICLGRIAKVIENEVTKASQDVPF